MLYLNDRVTTCQSDVADILDDTAAALLSRARRLETEDCPDCTHVAQIERRHAHALIGAATHLRNAHGPTTLAAAITMAVRAVADAYEDDEAGEVEADDLDEELGTAWAYVASLANLPANIEPHAWLASAE